MMLQKNYKDIDKAVSVMKKELEKVIVKSNERLEEAIELFRRSEVCNFSNK